MHTISHQIALRAATGETLDLVIDEIRAAHPEAFHTDESLTERHFFHQPLRAEPHTSFVRAFVVGVPATA